MPHSLFLFDFMHGESIEIEKQKSTPSAKKNEFISLTHYHRSENGLKHIDSKTN